LYLRQTLKKRSYMQAMTIVPMEHLKHVLRWLRTGEREVVQEIDLQWEQTDTRLDFADVAGQSAARLAARDCSDWRSSHLVDRPTRSWKNNDRRANSNHHAGVIY
jgi:hypothetical protein